MDDKLFDSFIDNRNLTAQNGSAYSFSMYLKDLHNLVWKREAKNVFDRNLENQYLALLLPMLLESSEKNGKPEFGLTKLIAKPYLLEELARVEKIVTKRMKSSGNELHYANLLKQIQKVIN